MSDVRARIADALREAGTQWVLADDDDENPFYGTLADALLSLPDVAIVKLPEPIQFKPGWTDFGFTQVDDRAPRQVAYFTSMAWAGTWTSTDEAKKLAAALLAAANAAEVVTPQGDNNRTGDV